MKHFTKILTAILCATALLSAVVLSACANNDLQAKVKDLELTVTQLKAQNQTLQTSVDEKHAEIIKNIRR